MCASLISEREREQVWCALCAVRCVVVAMCTVCLACVVCVCVRGESERDRQKE